MRLQKRWLHMLDQTDGSFEQAQRAMSISSICYTLAQLPKERRQESILSMQSAMNMSDEDFEVFRKSIVVPMIKRYDQMFKNSAHTAFGFDPPAEPSRRSQPITTEPAAKEPEPLPYAPCRCNSGRKYKFCCKPTKSHTGVR